MAGTINLTIYGNHEDKKGNPVPYTRVVGRALWTKAGKRYAAWKDWVQTCFYYGSPKEATKNWIVGRNKPIQLKPNQKAKMDIRIFWKNNAHADPDNIYKGIADSLFQNDKNLDGSFESAVDPENPRVEVKITIKN